ncbi:Eukaryotic translation initiation factor 2D [Symbiodinium microadriaticum]|uniref:Eukaryotic translation initiation factor 2D n=1 Tax=Symbiodinium microadriaticum TaxID=2951 RepID=A0A1Q9D7K5_SYMMI|nr:Eukaryotic translation initiation factor 2D [Symbiodinium microadriaticum]
MSPVEVRAAATVRERDRPFQAMFKKSSTVAFKGEVRIRGKETKALSKALAASAGEAVAEVILPNKVEIVVRKAGGGSTLQFVFAGDECVLVQLDGKADLGQGELMPTLVALWKVPSAESWLPSAIIQRPVAKFVFGGANVMAPGILRIVPPEGSEVLPREGNLVAVRAEGNPAACAVGRLRLPAAAVGPGTKGEAVEVLHYFGDALWEAMGSPRPDGFVGAEIQPTEATEAQASAPAEAQGYPPTTEVDAAKDSEESGAKAGPDMDKALEETLLQAIKTRIKDRDLPMAGNVVYTQHMRPCRRAGSNIDVKVSSFKKLGAFLAHAEELGWIAMKKSSDPVMTRIFRDHPDIREWKPWPKHVTAEADEAPAEAAGKDANCPSAAIQIELVWKIVKLKPILEVLKAEMPSDECWTRDECFQAVKLYADARDLWLKNNRKRIGPDPLLHSVLQTPSEESAASMSPDAVTDNILRTLPLCHRVTAPQGGAAGGLKTSVRPGKPPSVQVRTDTRRGHNVTLIQGLEPHLPLNIQKRSIGAMDVQDEAPPQRQRTNMADLRESLAAVGCRDEGVRGTFADKLKLKAATDAEILRDISSALASPGPEAVHAAALVRSISITPQAATNVCKFVLPALCSALHRQKETWLLAWALASMIRLAQHQETHHLLKRGGAVQTLALFTRPSYRSRPGQVRLDVMASIGLGFLSTAGKDTAASVPLRVVPELVRLLSARFRNDVDQVVEGRIFCGMPVDYRPRFVAQALVGICEASAAHAAVAWQTALPSLLHDILTGELPNDTEVNQPYGSPDVVEMANRCRTALLAHAKQGGIASAEAVAALRSAPAAPKGTWEKRSGQLSAYGVNMEAFASSLQKALASAAVVEEASPTQTACVMVQGFWDVAVMDWLVKVGIPSECILHQAKKGQQQKKAKQASNIVKS